MKRVFVDGACSGNPGPWACAWSIDGKIWTSAGKEPGTNNLAELMAIWQATHMLEDHDEAIFYCDSKVAISWLTKNIPCQYDEFRQGLWDYVRVHDIHVHFKRIVGKSCPEAIAVDRAAKAAIKLLPAKKEKLSTWIEARGRPYSPPRPSVEQEAPDFPTLESDEDEIMPFLMGMFPGGMK